MIPGLALANNTSDFYLPRFVCREDQPPTRFIRDAHVMYITKPGLTVRVWHLHIHQANDVTAQLANPASAEALAEGHEPQRRSAERCP